MKKLSLRCTLLPIIISILPIKTPQFSKNTHFPLKPLPLLYPRQITISAEKVLNVFTTVAANDFGRDEEFPLLKNHKIPALITPWPPTVRLAPAFLNR
ncbi:hypothetical protein JTE90_005837 [Oedothorax gibbosus]|uniref:Uncharacterized protein n=1 Tax=Oedothorax gibbosus TaxID=931172 RepID=A0AAV6V582_9ARAC|nr:hypothetical protein JTE90_005837 [Oedothorax gibbosus]